jgi:hypothetical protein
VQTQFPDGQYGEAKVLEMMVFELTNQWQTRRDLAAGRVLLDLALANEQARAEHEAAEAEAAEAAAAAERAACAAEEHAAERARAWAEEEERARLRALSVDSHADDCDGDCDGECEADWDEEALLQRALVRLGAGRIDRDGDLRLEPWVVEAALARAPEAGPLSEGERATLALVTAGTADGSGGAEDECARPSPPVRG